MLGEYSRSFVVPDDDGLHLRPAAVFAKIANQFDCNIIVRKGDKHVSGKSVLGLLTICATKGSEITVLTKGRDAQEALDALTAFFETSFASSLKRKTVSA